MQFICGTLNAEDLVAVPGGKWIVASGMSGGESPGHGALHLIDRSSKYWTTVFPGLHPQIRPDPVAYPGCPGAPDRGKFEARGLNLRPGPNGDDILYVVNHVSSRPGGRRSS